MLAARPGAAGNHQSLALIVFTSIPCLRDGLNQPQHQSLKNRASSSIEWFSSVPNLTFGRNNTTSIAHNTHPEGRELASNHKMEGYVPEEKLDNA